MVDHAEERRGYLVLDVEEASGKTKEDQYIWDTTPFEGFVKVEVRGGPRPVKAQTRKMPVVGQGISWSERLVLEVIGQANELRLMLCREKYQGTKRGTSVIAACGIYVSDILDAVPIDKYFELFKPNAGGEGGYIRIGMKFVRSLDELSAPGPAGTRGIPPEAALAMKKMQETGRDDVDGARQNRKRGGLPVVPAVLVAVGALGFVVLKKVLH